MTFLDSYQQHLQIRRDFKAIFFSVTPRNAVLDGIRAIAILLVILLHTVIGITKLLDTEQTKIYIANLPRWLDIAWQARGSDIIFILCGLLVSLSLFKEHQRSGSIKIFSYYRRRLFRIYPLFFLALLLYLLADSDRYIYLPSNLLFVTNLISGQKNIIPIGWSLNIQMQFYFLLPLFLNLLLFFSLHLQSKPKLKLTALILLVAMLTILAFTLRYLAASDDPSFYQTPFYHFFSDESAYAKIYGDTLYYNLSTRIGPFLLGVLVAYLYFYQRQTIATHFDRQPFISTLYLLLGLGLIYSALSVAIHDEQRSFYHPFDPIANLIYLTTNKYIFCIGVSIILVIVMIPKGFPVLLSRFLSLGVWRPLSTLIYPIYLFHFPFIIIAAIVVFQTTDKSAITSVSTPQVLLLALLATLFSTAFAIIPHLFLERPFISMAKKIY